MENSIKQRVILICLSSKCKKLNAEDLYHTFNKAIKDDNLSNYIKIEPIDCIYLHKLGPIVLIHPDNVLYIYVKKADIKDIIQQHLLQNKPVDRLLYKNSSTGKLISSPEEVYFALFGKRLQLKIVKIPISKEKVKNKKIVKSEHREKKLELQMKIEQLKKEKRKIKEQIEHLKKQKKELEH